MLLFLTYQEVSINIHKSFICLLILVQRTGHLLSNLNFGRFFGIRSPSREKWMLNSVFRDHAISVFMDWSKIDAGTDSGIFSD